MRDFPKVRPSVRGIKQHQFILVSSQRTVFVGNDGVTVDERMEELLDEAYFTGEYVISPAEVKASWTTGELDTAEYSYSLLGLIRSGEREEWRDTINTEALVVSDRVASGSTIDTFTSVWTTDAGDWRGSLAWNDNHVKFEQTNSGFTTKYGSDVNSANDHIFADNVPATAAWGDAVMIFYDQTSVDGN